MNIIYFTLIISLLLAAVFLGVFLWATKSGQYDDLETPGHRILIDDYKQGKNHKMEEKDERSDGSRNS